MNDIQPQRDGFHLDKANGKVFGVCAGIGNYFGLDPMLVCASPSCWQRCWASAARC